MSTTQQAATPEVVPLDALTVAVAAAQAVKDDNGRTVGRYARRGVELEWRVYPGHAACYIEMWPTTGAVYELDADGRVVL